MDDVAKKRFLWGVLLAWLPGIPLLLPLLREFVNQKQTGLGAVAGGLSEYFVTLGLVAAFAFSILSIILLMRSFSKGHWMRSVFSLFSIVVSVLLLAIFSLYIWLMYFFQHRS